MDEALLEFLLESAEAVSQLDQDLVLLEKNPHNPEALNRIFRAVHSIKGTCGMFGLSRLGRVAHAKEDVLAAVREGALVIDSRVIGVFLQSVDVMKMILASIENTKREPVGDDSLVIANLKQLLKKDSSIDWTRSLPLVVEDTIETTLKSWERPSVSENSLRINVTFLDGLMSSIEELLLTRDQLLQMVRQDKKSRYLPTIDQLSRITSDLQQAVLKTRMQPIGNAWSKMPRFIRDLSQLSAKKIDLKMMGQETEVDRQILQAVQDPLLHCVRNSVDHGIESPEIRKANSKSIVGTISLNAFVDGNHIVIEIEDDGGGINIEAVKAKAVERGLIRASDAQGLSDHQVCRFIFEPGFSTANQVTEVSGRGVGMDVVRTNIEKLGGKVELKSILGFGTTVRIKIPLPLMGIPAEDFATPAA